MIQKDIQQTLLTAQLTPSSAYQTKNKQLQPVLDALWENKSLRLNLQELADLVHLTPTYLSRLLKEEFGIPFSQFYRQLKITWAKQLLLETDKTIAQISEDLGFVEDSYFVRIFKQETVKHLLNTVKRKNRAKQRLRSRCFTLFAVANATSAKGALYLSCDKVILLNMNW